MAVNLPRRRSLVLWALLAMAMVLGSYLVILLVAAMRVYLPFLAVTSLDSPSVQVVVLLLIDCLIGQLAANDTKVSHDTLVQLFGFPRQA